MTDLPVVVGTDGSPAGRAAVDWAADEAARRGLPLRLVHASVWGAYEGEGRPLTDAVVREAAERVRRRRPGVEVAARVLLGEPEPTLLDEGDTASVLVLGSRTLGAVAKALLGAVSLPVVARARCPVVVVRGPAPGPDDPAAPVVLGVGDHGSGTPAARFAFQEAAARGCPVWALHAWTVPRAQAPTAHTGHLDDARRSELAEARQRMADVLARVEADHPEVPVRRTLGEGHAPELLLNAAGSAALLVIGARRREHHTAHRLGPVAHAALHHAPCPVAVVPHR
jgi:nucleotide-binding universal stress UspA family protein